MKLLLASLLVVLAPTRAPAFLALPPRSARPAAARRRAAGDDDGAGRPPAGDPTRAGASNERRESPWERSVTESLERIGNDLREIKGGIRDIRRDIGGLNIDMVKEFGGLKREFGDIKSIMAGIFFLQVLLLFQTWYRLAIPL
jgi:hypothetical protein